MKMTFDLNEGLRKSDLADLIENVISIDEFESKIGGEDEIIVLAFFLKSERAAVDLKGFLETSSIDIIDVSVSPAPNENNEFLVFVEIDRDKKSINRVLKIAEEVSKISNINEWFMIAYRHEKKVPLNQENLSTMVDFIPDHMQHQHLKEFFESVKNIVYLSGNRIDINGLQLEFVENYDVNKINECVNFDIEMSATALILEKKLAKKYVIIPDNQDIIIMNEHKNECLRFKIVN